MMPDNCSNPLVSCLLVTRNRPLLALRAIRSFLDQTYQNRELIIVDESGEDWSTMLPPSPLIRWHHFPSGRGPLGKMRNLSLALASGDVVMQWDDDDWSHPDRISKQLNSLNGRSLGFLSKLTLFWPARRHIGVTSRRTWECTFIARRKGLDLTYPEISKAEDSELFSRLIPKCPFQLLDAPELYVRTVHGANTWDAGHFSKLLKLPGYVPLGIEHFKSVAKRTGWDSSMGC